LIGTANKRPISMSQRILATQLLEEGEIVGKRPCLFDSRIPSQLREKREYRHVRGEGSVGETALIKPAGKSLVKVTTAKGKTKNDSRTG